MRKMFARCAHSPQRESRIPGSVVRVVRSVWPAAAATAAAAAAACRQPPLPQRRRRRRRRLKLCATKTTHTHTHAAAILAALWLSRVYCDFSSC